MSEEWGRGSEERDINVMMEREYHIISGTNPLRVLRSSSAVFYPFFVEFFMVLCVLLLNLILLIFPHSSLLYIRLMTPDQFLTEITRGALVNTLNEKEKA